jgi:hypothetical protein
MGFDPAELPIVARAFDAHRWPIASTSLESIVVDDGRTGAQVPLDRLTCAVEGGFRPHFGWTVLRPGA